MRQGGAVRVADHRGGLRGKKVQTDHGGEGGPGRVGRLGSGNQERWPREATSHR